MTHHPGAATRRRLARLGPHEASEYAAVVASLTPAIERSLGQEVVANRAIGRGAVPTSALEPWRPARAAWRGRLQGVLAAGSRPVVLVADVRDCYASIRPTVLATRLLALGADPRRVARVRAVLERLEDGAGGLPVGPAPSAILANAVLGALDEGLRRAGVPHLRWVDDIVALATGHREAVRAHDSLRRSLDAVSLDPHPSKTAILRDRDQAQDRLLRGGPSTARTSVR